MPGVAVTLAPVVAESPVAGLHKYVGLAPAPEAVRSMLPAAPHTLVLAGDMLMTGVVHVASR